MHVIWDADRTNIQECKRRSFSALTHEAFGFCFSFYLYWCIKSGNDACPSVAAAILDGDNLQQWTGLRMFLRENFTD